MVDLSLIRLFVVIYETNNISRAAERLHLSQPSVTYNLNRLRKTLQDPLFVRDKFGVKPTKLAQSLYPSFYKALSDIQLAIVTAKNFDPKTTNKVFRLGLSDLGEICLLPFLVKYLSKEAPEVKLEIEEVQSNKVEEWLISGFLDVAVFNNSYTLMPKIESANLFEENYLCIAYREHPRLKHCTKLTLQQYLAEKHIGIKSSTGHREVEQSLKQLGVTRHISVEVPHFSVLQDVINQSEYLVTVPSRGAQFYFHNSDIRIFELPFPVKPFNVSLNWYQHNNDDLETKLWFLNIITNIFSKL